MKRLLIISDSPFAPSVFGRLTRGLAVHLHEKGVPVAVLGFGYPGWPYNDSAVPYPLYPWIGPPRHPHNIDDVLEEFAPDTLLLLGAPILFDWLGEHPNRKAYRVVLHTAFTSPHRNPPMREMYRGMDAIAVNSRYEEESLRTVLPDAEIHRIPPCIDPARFPSSAVRMDEDGGQYGVACVAYDTLLMDIPTLMKAWGILAKRTSDMAFGLFTDPAQVMSWNIPDLIDVYSLRERITVNSNPLLTFGFPSLGDLYSSIDLLVLPSGEEALNPVALEAAYLGVPLITASGGATAEFLPEHAVSPRITDTFIAPPRNTRYTIFDADELAEMIMERYDARTSPRPEPRTDFPCLGAVVNQWVDIL